MTPRVPDEVAKHHPVVTEMDARNSRPDLFALADDLLEAELVRTGRLSFTAAA